MDEPFESFKTEVRVSPPPTEAERAANIDADYWDEWAASIDFKVSRQGQLLLGLGGAVLLTLAITGIQGRVVVKLVTSFREVADVLTKAGLIASDTPDTSEAKGRYNQESGSVTTTAAPVDDDLLAELHDNIAKTKDPAPKPEDVL